MKRILDINKWNRKEHFHFFSSFDEPFSGLTTEVDCTKAVQICKEKQYKFSLYYLHKSMLASNEIENFRYRIEDKQVAIYDKIHGTMTVIRDDYTFGFTHFEFHADFKDFVIDALKAIQHTKNAPGLCFNDNTQRPNTIHYSTSPWFGFTHVHHARNYNSTDSIPKIVFGKYQNKNGRLMMPVSLQGHHALIDGYHIGLFLNAFQQYLNKG